jgi:hypothetical protein
VRSLVAPSVVALIALIAPAPLGAAGFHEEQVAVNDEEDSTAWVVAVSRSGNATCLSKPACLAVSDSGRAACDALLCLAASRSGNSSGDLEGHAVSLTGDAHGWTAYSATGEAYSLDLSVSATGPSYSKLAVSGTGPADTSRNGACYIVVIHFCSRGAAVSALGDAYASDDKDCESCPIILGVAVSGAGRSRGPYAVSLLGEAEGDQSVSGCDAVASLRLVPGCAAVPQLP